jgi:NAD(P)-dependent dehydrogenase (short-subunit alcohol dehydrogenase family)
MDLQLRGKRALVTGSSSGIGSGIARVLASEGVFVLIHGRDSARAQAVADDILRSGGSASVVLGDLATDAGAQAVAEAALRNGALDILVNNAGGTTLEGNPSWFETPLDAWGAAFSQNVRRRRICWYPACASAIGDASSTSAAAPACSPILSFRTTVRARPRSTT